MEELRKEAGFNRCEWFCLAVGLAGGTAWFGYMRSLDFGPYPAMADAVIYAQISNSFQNFTDALTYAGDRTFGFPAFLYLIKRIAELFGVGSANTLQAVQTAVLLTFHFLSSIYFFRALRKLFASQGFQLNFFALILILVHPGLISHTSVLLTDTFVSDLVMIGAALIAGTFMVSSRRLLLRGALTGIIWGMAVGCRPFVIVSVGSGILLASVIAIFSRDTKRLSLFLVPLACGAVLTLLPATLHCRATYSRFCMQNPAFASNAASQSLQIGLTSFRTYWSIRSHWPSTIVIPNDPSLLDNFGRACDIGQVNGPGPWLHCIASRPLFVPVYTLKKLMAIFDSFFFQPYASDITPTWAIRYSRAFAALSFTGFFCAVGFFFVFVRRRMTWEAIAFSLPLLAILFQIPMHIEGRYGFTAVPLSMACAIGCFQIARRRGRRAFAGFLLMAAMLSTAFLVQTHLWDLDDLVLQQIEGNDR